MFALLHSSLLLLAEAGHAAAAEGGFTKFYNDYLNIPGFEVWKFINLALFIGLMIYLVRKPLGDAFRARRDQIRGELIRAEEEKQAALAKLTAAEAKLAQIEAEKEAVIRKAREEAEFEKNRITEHAQLEAERIRQQAEAELARIQNQSRADLRRFSAEESIRLAEEKLRSKIDITTDAKLVKASIDGIGGLN